MNSRLIIVADIHGSYGIFSFYTDKKTEATRDVPGGHIERVTRHKWAYDCTLPGPVNSFDQQRKSVDIPFTVHVDPSHPVARIAVQKQEFILQEDPQKTYSKESRSG